MKWQKIILTNQQVASGDLQKLSHLLTDTVKTNASAIKDVTVFAVNDDENGGMSLFFTPNATELFSSVIYNYAPVDCVAPKEKDVSSFFFDAELP